MIFELFVDDGSVCVGMVSSVSAAGGRAGAVRDGRMFFLRGYL